MKRARESQVRAGGSANKVLRSFEKCAFVTLNGMSITRTIHVAELSSLRERKHNDEGSTRTLLVSFSRLFTLPVESWPKPNLDP